MPGSKRPRISVLMPVRDAGTTIEVCLRSISRQTLTDWECVVVDDGSGDGTLEIARRHAAGDGRFRFLRYERAGLVPALVRGLEACRGGIVARMDGDDLMHRRRLELQADALERDGSLDAIGCGVRLFPRSSLGEGMRQYERWLNAVSDPDSILRDAFVECPVAHPALAVRADRLRALGYRDMGWPEDYDLVLRMLEEGCRIGVVRRRLLSWRHGPGRLSRADPRYGTERFTACKAHFIRRTILSGTDRYTLWGYGHTGRALRRALERLGRHASRIVEVHPGRLEHGVRGARVIGPGEVRRDTDRPMLVSVAGEKPRREIRDFLDDRGFIELEDYVCTA